MNTKKDINFPIGFTAIDNRLFYMQELLSPSAFSILIRIYRMSNGYDSKPKAMSNTYFQNYCNVSKNTVTKLIKELESLGIVNTKKRTRATTLYSINLSGIHKKYLESINDDSQELFESISDNDQVCSQELGTTKQNLLKQNNTKENINIPFSDFWNKYDYAKGQVKSIEAKWCSMTDEERTLTMIALDKYILSTPDKTFRKYPMTYLNTEAWNDEIVIQDKTNNSNSNKSCHSDVYSASFKPFDTNSSNHAKDELESKLEGDSFSSANGLDTVNDSGAGIESVLARSSLLAASSAIHWSELKAKGLLKPKTNPSALKTNTKVSDSIDDFLNRNGSKRFSNLRDIA